MNEKKQNVIVINVEQLSKRWQCSMGHIYNQVKNGTLSPVKGGGRLVFSLEQIELLEMGDVDPMSPLERKRLEKKIASLEEENVKLKSHLKDIVRLSTECIV